MEGGKFLSPFLLNSFGLQGISREEKLDLLYETEALSPSLTLRSLSDSEGDGGYAGF